MLKQPGINYKQRISMAMSPHPSVFAPLVFAGRLEEGIQQLSKAGFNGVEISVRHAGDLDPDWLATKVEQAGLEVSAFASGRMCLEKSLCLSDPDSEVRQKVFEDLSAIIRLAGQFAAPMIIGGVRGKLTGDKVQKSNQRACALETIFRCAQVAKEVGTCLLIEPINRYEINFVNSAQDSLDLIKELGHPALKILLDTFHMNIEEVDMCAAIRKVGSRLGYVHFADSNRLAPGQGHINFQALLRALAEIDYRGFISAEILPLPDDPTALSQTGHFMHALLNELAVH